MLGPALAIALALTAGATYPHHRRVAQPNLPKGSSTTPVFQFLPTAVSTAQECTGSALTGSLGETITTSRSGNEACTKSDGTVLVMTTNQPALETNGVHVEAPGVNSILQSRDLSNASWTKSSMTCAKTATGTDAVSSSASTCTASGSNATVLQTVTTAATGRASSLYLRRNAGTGTVNVTRDNGATWTAVALTSTWQRFGAFHNGVAALQGSVLNPTIGVQLVTSGDAVDVDRVQDEVGAFETSPIDTTTTAVTRNATAISFARPAALAGDVGCVQADVWQDGPSAGGANRVISFSAAGRSPLVQQTVTQTLFFDNTNTYFLNHSTVTALQTTLHVFAGWRASDNTGYVGAAGVKCSTGCTNSGGTNGAYVGTTFTGTTIYIGSSVGASGFLNGYVKALLFYSSRDRCA